MCERTHLLSVTTVVILGFGRLLACRDGAASMASSSSIVEFGAASQGIFLWTKILEGASCTTAMPILLFFTAASAQNVLLISERFLLLICWTMSCSAESSAWNVHQRIPWSHGSCMAGSTVSIRHSAVTLMTGPSFSATSASGETCVFDCVQILDSWSKRGFVAGTIRHLIKWFATILCDPLSVSSSDASA
jgi:hypothetical protein